jgi:CMP-N-acetylneuraminic acid synthetase
MRTISTVLLISSFLLASPVMAGAGHEHGPGGSHAHGPISSDAAVKKAEKQVKSLVQKGKLDKSWSAAKLVESVQKDFGKGQEWVVSFKNDQEKDTAKQTLYVFYTLNGSYLATNFTGK